MKQYPHIISKLYYEPLLITRARHHAICQIVESHMAKVANMPSFDPMDEQDEPDEDDMMDTGGTAIIPVRGVITARAADIPASSCGCGLDDVRNMIDVATSDPNVSKIVFNFDSPGGAVTGVPELARKIAGIASKETVAYTDTECCSGALWLAAQCQRFYATESSAVGSIGVWCAYLDLSRQLQNEGQNVQEFSAGKYKTMGAWWKPLTKEEAAMVQASVDKIYGQFKEAMQTRRMIPDEYMQGQIFDGLEAVEAGIVDGLVESLEEVL